MTAASTTQLEDACGQATNSGAASAAGDADEHNHFPVVQLVLAKPAAAAAAAATAVGGGAPAAQPPKQAADAPGKAKLTLADQKEQSFKRAAVLAQAAADAYRASGRRQNVYRLGTKVSGSMREWLNERGWVEFDPRRHTAYQGRLTPPFAKLYWHDGRFPHIMHRNCKLNQRLNKFQDVGGIAHKDLLVVSMRRLREALRQGGIEPATVDRLTSFTPRTWLVPRERPQLRRFMADDARARADRAAKTTAAAAAAAAAPGAPAAGAPAAGATTAAAAEATATAVTPVAAAASADVTAARLFIGKPARSSRGRNIFLFKTEEQLDRALSENKDAPNSGVDTFVVQSYIERPWLVGGYKFDVRLYVLVTSYLPLRAFVHGLGLARFATQPYTGADWHEAFAHLTNASLNKNSETIDTDKPTIGRGAKWELARLAAYLDQHGRSTTGGDGDGAGAGDAGKQQAEAPGDPSTAAAASSAGGTGDGDAGKSACGKEQQPPPQQQHQQHQQQQQQQEQQQQQQRPQPMTTWQRIWARISDAMLLTLLSVTDRVPPDPCSFEVLGFDFMLDHRGRVWLLEVNSSPAMLRHEPADETVKRGMLGDLFACLGLDSLPEDCPDTVPDQYARRKGAVAVGGGRGGARLTAKVAAAIPPQGKTVNAQAPLVASASPVAPPSPLRPVSRGTQRLVDAAQRGAATTTATATTPAAAQAAAAASSVRPYDYGCPVESSRLGQWQALFPFSAAGERLGHQLHDFVQANGAKAVLRPLKESKTEQDKVIGAVSTPAKATPAAVAVSSGNGNISGNSSISGGGGTGGSEGTATVQPGRDGAATAASVLAAAAASGAGAATAQGGQGSAALLRAAQAQQAAPVKAMPSDAVAPAMRRFWAGVARLIEERATARGDGPPGPGPATADDAAAASE